MRYLFSLLLALTLSTTAFAGEFYINSPAFHDKQRIPVLYTCNGKNLSPPLSWGNAPANTKSFVLILSAPHWITMEVYLWLLYNIPAEVKGLNQGGEPYLPHGTMVGTNYYEEEGYSGPCPPDANLHRYVFTLYALDTVLSPIEDHIEPEKLLTIIKPHILKQATWAGVFSH